MYLFSIEGLFLQRVFSLRTFFARAKKVPKKTRQGVRGGLFRQGQALTKRHMPLPLGSPTPHWGAVCFLNRGGVATPFLQGFLQLLSVGTPTEMDGADGSGRRGGERKFSLTEPFACGTERGVATPCLRSSLQHLSVGAPTEMDGSRMILFDSSALEEGA